MKNIHIKDKLKNIGTSTDKISLGDFDAIGEYTAKRQRAPSSDLYRKVGFTYRSNYERGILVYNLIRQYEIKSMLEIGFGRGYTTFCAAKAMSDAGIDGKITTIDPALEKNNIEPLAKLFPQDWFDKINFIKGMSGAVLPTLEKTYDLVYIDGDHSYEGTKLDWEGTKDKFNKLMLFDDYHLPSKDDPGIECSKLIDEIKHEDVNCNEPELIFMDRRMFFDDRGISDEDLDYGQVLLTKEDAKIDEW